MYKDFLGRELEIGDMVVVTSIGYRELRKAKIIAFTPKKVRVEFKSRDTYLSDPNFLVKIV